MQRRFFVRNLLALAGAATLTTDLLAQTPPHVEVWKDPNCGCCEDWVSHLRANGFTVQVHNSGNTAARARLGVPDALGSCHTAQVGGYALEGHVPARDIHRLLKERPNAIGLAVPGMPIGSPGMDGAVYGGRRDAYDVLIIQRGGGTRTYQHYPRA
ncbi:MAG: DUF411 domain-containing protein [Rhodoferax sp.]